MQWSTIIGIQQETTSDDVENYLRELQSPSVSGERDWRDHNYNMKLTIRGTTSVKGKWNFFLLSFFHFFFFLRFNDYNDKSFERVQEEKN